MRARNPALARPPDAPWGARRSLSWESGLGLVDRMNRQIATGSGDPTERTVILRTKAVLENLPQIMDCPILAPQWLQNLAAVGMGFPQLGQAIVAMVPPTAAAPPCMAWPIMPAIIAPIPTPAPMPAPSGAKPPPPSPLAIAACSTALAVLNWR